MHPIFYDTETCGFHGPTCLIQYAEGEQEINLHSVFVEPIYTTLELIEEIMYHSSGVVGFNLAFDHFKLSQTYTTLTLLANKVGRSALPTDHITEYALCEPEARNGVCLRPQKALDLMLHARKGKYQSTMDRKDIRIRRVPTMIAWELANILTLEIPLPDIYFARRSDPSVRWQVFDIHNDLGEMIMEFKDLVLKFSPSVALKALCYDAGISKNDRLLFKDVELPKKARPVEIGYAPFALAIGKPGNWNGAWPDVIRRHITHWSYNRMAREYAKDDVIDTRNLYKFFDSPELGDIDSELACAVASVRWKGYEIDKNRIEGLRDDAIKIEQGIRKIFNYNAPKSCRVYLEQVMDDTEKIIIQGSTKAIILEEVSKWTEQTVCKKCDGLGCKDCNDGLIDSNIKHPAAIRAQQILDARHASKEIEQFTKLLAAGKFHTDFKVIGALSGRMAGGGGLNPQGIKRTQNIRGSFPLADFNDPDIGMVGGDFAGFEVVLTDAVYADPVLHEDLKSGKKIHGLLGQEFFPDKTYEEILESKNTATNPEEDFYTRSKNGVFALIYMGEAYTLSNRVGIPESVAEEAYQRFIKRYRVFGQKRKKIIEQYGSMKQPNGIGTKVHWEDPPEYAETMFGFRRYYTLENLICKVLYNLAQKPPKHWTQISVKVTRRDREQSTSGAARTALFAAAFAVQGQNVRSAGNHIIQGSGAYLTKVLQYRLWGLQPKGINNWRIQPMNIHDEILAPIIKSYIPDASKIVKDFLEEFRSQVPLIEMDWGENLKSWADK